jgi:hypothetical protein
MKIKPNCKIREIAGEKMVVMQSKEGVDLTRVILLNKSAEWLWISLSGQEFTLDSSAEILAEKYGIERERAMSDAKIWIDSMVKAELIEL